MNYVIAFVTLFVAYSVIWIASLVVYSMLIGGIDFGVLWQFALKSAALVAVVSLLVLIPFGGWLALAAWWFGAVFLFDMEFWEAKVLVLIVWALSFAIRFAVFAAMVSAKA
jgi:hypothetical protein